MMDAWIGDLRFHILFTVLSLSPTEVEIVSVVDGVPVPTAFHYHMPVPGHPYETEILLKRT